MKDKIKIIILCIIFVAILLGINKILNQQSRVIEETNIESVEEENMSVLDVTSNNFEEEVLKSDKPVLIDFYADWCGPCKMLSPIVDEVANENDDVKVCRINIDNEQDLAVEYGIMSIPTLVVIKNGEETNRSVGVIEKDEILEMIK